MDRWVGKVAMVTCGSSEIGAAISQRLAKEGMLVIAVSSDVKPITQLMKDLAVAQVGRLQPYQADITKENEVLETFAWSKTRVGPVAVLINNESVIGRTSLSEGDANVWRQAFETNVVGPLLVTREAIRTMKSEKIDGHVININNSNLCDILRKEPSSQDTKVKITSIQNADKNTLTADDVADAVIYALSTPERLQIHDIVISHN